MFYDENNKPKEKVVHEKSKLIRSELIDSKDEGGLKNKILEIQNSRKYVTVEVGCGENPKLSCKLQKCDYLVAVDPSVTTAYMGINRGLNEVTVGSDRLVVRGKASELDGIKANRINLVAPNPVNIVKDNLLGEIESLLKVGTEILIVLDLRTEESTVFFDKASEKVRDFLDKNYMEDIDFDHDMKRESHYMHSEDLGSKNVVFRAKKTR